MYEDINYHSNMEHMSPLAEHATTAVTSVLHISIYTDVFRDKKKGMAVYKPFGQ